MLRQLLQTLGPQNGKKSKKTKTKHVCVEEEEESLTSPLKKKAAFKSLKVTKFHRNKPSLKSDYSDFCWCILSLVDNTGMLIIREP